MTEPTKEQTWKEEARKAYQDQQSQDNEGGCREPIGFVQGYIAAKKSDFEKIAELEKLSDMQARDAFSRYDEIKTLKDQLKKCEKSLMKVACFETHGENKYINHEQAYTGVANFARRYFQDKENKDEK